MTRKILFFATWIWCMSGIAAFAQATGYYRLQNAATSHIAQLSGHTYVSPSATAEEAHVLPGTVAYCAIEDNHFSTLTIQNVDVVNTLIPLMKAVAMNLIDEERFAGLKDTLQLYVTNYMSGTVADLVIPLIKKYTYEDFQEYIATADSNIYLESAGDGRYYLYVNTPKFPLNAGILNSYLTGVANDYLDMLRYRIENMVDEYLVGREYLKPLAYSIGNNFYFSDKLYLTEQNDEVYGPQFGFACTKRYEEQGLNAQWKMPAVDDENYFAVEGEVNDASGTWYTSIALGFPVRLSTGMKAYYLADKVDAANSQVEYHEITDEVIPAMTPMILQLNGLSAVENKLSPASPVSNVIDGNALQCATDSLGFLMGFDIPAPDTHYYVLGRNGDKVCMVETTQTYFAANTPYFYLSDDQKASNTTGYLELVSEVNGIRQMSQSSPSNGLYYDLQGRRVQHPTHGLYIVNGKKMVFN